MTFFIFKFIYLSRKSELIKQIILQLVYSYGSLIIEFGEVHFF